MPFKFETLAVWQKSMNYADKCFDIARKLPQTYRFSLIDQLVRAALSIPANIAEGNGRRSVKEQHQFYNIAKGSAYETVTILMLCRRSKLMSDLDYQQLYAAAEEICRMLSGLMAGRVR